MSLEKFFQEVEKNKELQAELVQATSEDILNVAQKHGFDISAKALKDFKASPPIYKPEECGNIYVNSWAWCTGKLL